MQMVHWGFGVNWFIFQGGHEITDNEQGLANISGVMHSVSIFAGY